ncbi:MAG TPA: hypothetical protein VE775_00875, partial [Pyrinomonadaceae bacterium]|nr:hypothetical protein [Pyrinomonadaceae bacterium]
MISAAQLYRSLRLLVAACALLCAAATGAHALPLVDYRAHVAAADDAISGLLALYESAAEDEQTASTPQFRSAEAAALGELRVALPVTEKVEWAGGTLDV